MNPEQRIKALEDEVKVLKNEVKTVLLDIREHYLSLENPFSLHKANNGQEAPVDVPKVDVEPEEIIPPEETKMQNEGPSVKEPPLEPPPAKQEAVREHPSGVPRINLITIVGLTQWATRAVSRLGGAKAEALIEIYYATGRLPPGFRDVMIKIARLSVSESGDGRADPREYLSTLTELDSLVNGDNQFDAALLSILSDEEGRK